MSKIESQITREVKFQFISVHSLIGKNPAAFYIGKASGMPARGLYLPIIISISFRPYFGACCEKVPLVALIKM
jgi:hypothetical protein